jgi:hypothetical protein
MKKIHHGDLQSVLHGAPDAEYPKKNGVESHGTSTS